MKKNGFTFIEVLGVITLLALISVIVVLVVDKSLKDSKNTLYQAQIENIRSSANMWKTDNIEFIPDSGYYYITLGDLESSNYIDSEIINPKTNEIFDKDLVVGVGMDDILIGDETGYNSIEVAIEDFIKKEINLINQKMSTTTNDGVYYYNYMSNLEKDADIIFINREWNNLNGNILVHNHQFISGCITYKNYNYDYYKGTITKQDYPCSTVRGENLVVNGDLSYKNNTNFSGFNYNEDGYLSTTSNVVKTIFSDSFIPVDIANKAYEMGMTAKSNNQNAMYYLGFDSYDIDRNRVSSSNVMYRSNTLTTLADDLKDGSNFICLTDMTNWNTTTEQTYRRGFIFWNYKDSTGYEYPELTYSKNVWSSLYENENIDLEKKCIKLTSPWNHGDIPAGTKLSQSSAGGTYNFSLLNYMSIPNDWSKFNELISGIDDAGAINPIKFRAGTAYIKIMTWNNYDSISNVTTDYKDIYFREVIGE